MTPGIITGYVMDSDTGKPIRGATVSTEPPTSSVVTNGQGQYMISAPRAGLTTIRATANRYKQTTATCVTVNNGGVAYGDISMLYLDPSVKTYTPIDACDPVCSCDKSCVTGKCLTEPERLLLIANAQESARNQQIVAQSGARSGKLLLLGAAVCLGALYWWRWRAAA